MTKGFIQARAVIVRHSLQTSAERLQPTPGFRFLFTPQQKEKTKEEEKKTRVQEERDQRRQIEHEVLIEFYRVPSDNDASGSFSQQGSSQSITHQKVSITWILHDGNLCSWI